MLIPVIMSGGAGSRLWPVSRELHPKPFIKLSDGLSLLQHAYLRASGLPEVSAIVTITNRDLFFLTKDDYRDIRLKDEQMNDGVPPLRLSYILEPVGRNTAAAIACGAIEIAAQYGDDAIMLVLSADHLISNTKGFESAVAQAMALANQEKLVTFGITPTEAETGYGYIQAEGTVVKRFVEKPAIETAKQYLASGEYLWNAGIFCFKVSTILAAFEQHAPELLEKVKLSLGDRQVRTGLNEDEVELELTTFGQVPDISVDYAIMERANNVAVVACDIGWSDVGSWNAIGDMTPADESGNRIDANTVLHNTKNCFIKGESNRIIGTVGVDGLIIIDTQDALLVADKNSVQDVKSIVGQLKKINHDAYRLHRTVHRPWGTYTVLEDGDGFKMKRIVVKPGGSLSLQKHYHRSEHWVVVSGVAVVVNGDCEIMIRPNESTYIPAGQTHRLTNPGVLDCVLIEVQVGSYLGEDDIVRLNDVYGRA